MRDPQEPAVAAAAEAGNSVDYMTTAEVADLLRTPAETVRYWRHTRQGPKSFKVGRRVLYARKDVEQFIADAQRASA